MCDFGIEKYSVEYSIRVRDHIMEEVLYATVDDLRNCDGVLSVEEDFFGHSLIVKLDTDCFCCENEMVVFLEQKVDEWKLQE